MATYKERWEEFFRVFDVDNNGFLTPQDFTTVAKQITQKLGYGEDSTFGVKTVESWKHFIENFMRDLDANKDGTLSLPELIAGAEKFHVERDVSTVPEWWKSAARLFFAAFDANHNGEISLNVRYSSRHNNSTSYIFFC